MPRKESSPESRVRAKFFGEHLKTLRKAAGLNQKETSTIIGIDSSMLSRIEMGKHHPPRETSFYEGLLKLPSFTEFDIQSLFTIACGLFNGKDFVIPGTTLPSAILTPVDGMTVHIFTDPNKIDNAILERVRTEFEWDAKYIVERTLERRRVLDAMESESL